ncbi:MAG TPA: M28 family peptidase [Acidisarcina sp.]
MKSFLAIAVLSSSVLSSLALHAESAALPPLPGVPEEARAAAAGIDPEKIRAHVRFLSHDLLEGRGPGKRGGEIAAEYIATQFALAGLKPAGDNGSYFQRVPLYAVHTIEDRTSFELAPASGPAIPLKYGVDYVTKDQTGTESADIDAPIVFAGYGIDAPEYQWNDFEGVDVRGKVLLVIVSEPPSDDEKFFKGKALTYYGRWTYKYEEAARRGAVGVLIIHRTDLASYGWEVVQNSQAVEKSYLKGDPAATLKAASWIQLDVARKLFAADGASGGVDIDKLIDAAGRRGFHARELRVRLKAHIASTVRPYESNNVIGMVAGRGGATQAVFYTAHYDHLGIDPSLKGDQIYNGAADNATGCGIVLEMARAYAQSAVAPPHNVYFVSVTAEEQGLLGSQFLGMHPPLLAGRIALDLNYDDINPIGVPTSAVLNGAERTTFYPVVEATARALGFTVAPDPFPSHGSYYRSDHFSFARVGVPAFSVEQGTLFEGHDEEWGKQQAEDFNTNRYHHPSDEYRLEMDFRGNARVAQLGFLLGWQASSQTTPIEWQPGDEFEAARRRSAK